MSTNDEKIICTFKIIFSIFTLRGFTVYRFENNEIEILVTGSNPYEYIKIYTNYFYKNTRGIEIDGAAYFDSKKNFFSSNIIDGERIASTGSASNSSYLNEYTGRNGIVASGDNSRYIFSTNCFKCFQADMTATGYINISQGNQTVAASNCFTNTGIIPDFVCNTIDPIEYFVPNNTTNPIDPCYYPQFIANYFTNVSQDLDANQCGLTDTITPGYYHFIDIISCESLPWFISFWQNQLNNIMNNPNLTPRVKSIYKAEYERYIRYAQRRLMSCRGKTGDKLGVLEVATEEQTAEDRIYHMGLLIAYGDYQDARIANQIFRTQHPDHLSAAKTLEIATDHIMNPEEYILSSTNYQFLKQYAESIETYSGYARSLLYILTGEYVGSENPLAPRNLIQPDVYESKQAFNEIKIYPQPASSIINISADFDSEVSIMVYDGLGRKVLQQKVPQLYLHQLDIALLQPGMYFLTITDQGGMFENRKIIITR